MSKDLPEVLLSQHNLEDLKVFLSKCSQVFSVGTNSIQCQDRLQERTKESQSQPAARPRHPISDMDIQLQPLKEITMQPTLGLNIHMHPWELEAMRLNIFGNPLTSYSEIAKSQCFKLKVAVEEDQILVAVEDLYKNKQPKSKIEKLPTECVRQLTNK